MNDKNQPQQTDAVIGNSQAPSLTDAILGNRQLIPVIVKQTQKNQRLEVFLDTSKLEYVVYLECQHLLTSSQVARGETKLTDGTELGQRFIIGNKVILTTEEGVICDRAWKVAVDAKAKEREASSKQRELEAQAKIEADRKSLASFDEGKVLLELEVNGVLGKFIFDDRFGDNYCVIDGEDITLGTYYDLKKYGETGVASKYFADKFLTPARKPLADWAAKLVNSEDFRLYRLKHLVKCYENIALEDVLLPAIHVDGSRYMPATVSWNWRWIERYSGINFACKYEWKYNDETSITWAELYNLGLHEMFASEIEENTRRLNSMAQNLPTASEAKAIRKNYNDAVNEGGDGYLPEYLYDCQETRAFLIEENARLNQELNTLVS